MTQTLIVTRGLPASGKSTYAERELTLDFNLVRVERDLLRDQLFGHRDYSKLTAEHENTVTVMQKAMATAALKAGKSVIVSDTNLRAAYVREWAKLAARMGVEFSVINFDDISVDECVERDNYRNNSVGEDVIRNMASRFMKRGKLIPVDVSKELTDSLVIEPYINSVDLPEAIIVDIDGTLAVMADRSPYEWHRVGEDSPVDSVISAVKAAKRNGATVLIMSGRDSSCRDITQTWLNTYLYGYWDYLFMRPEGDNRKDDLIKYELFNKNIRGNYHINYVLDDRDQVVKMWRALGLTCFQVNYGDF